MYATLRPSMYSRERNPGFLTVRNNDLINLLSEMVVAISTLLKKVLNFLSLTSIIFSPHKLQYNPTNELLQLLQVWFGVDRFINNVKGRHVYLLFLTG